jgi:hypothetical protein
LINGNFDEDNKKFKKLKNKKVVPIGIRPYHFIVLQEINTNNEILFVNLHNDHDHDVQRNLNHIDSKLKNINFNYIIITGDFNATLSNPLKLNGKDLIISTLKRNTCCDINLNNSFNNFGKVDNILTYGFDVESVIDLFENKDNSLHSDHIPVIVKLKFKTGGKIQNPNPNAGNPANTATPNAIGFDFDGVFTNNTVIVDENGKESVICNRSDGIGLSRLGTGGVKLIIISTEINPVVTARGKKLKMPRLKTSSRLVFKSYTAVIWIYAL